MFTLVKNERQRQALDYTVYCCDIGTLKVVCVHTLTKVFLQNELSQRHNYFYHPYLRYEVLTALTRRLPSSGM